MVKNSKLFLVLALIFSCSVPVFAQRGEDWVRSHPFQISTCLRNIDYWDPVEYGACILMQPMLGTVGLP